MCNTNLILRIVTVCVFSLIILFLDNYYLFWLLLFYLLLLSIVDRNYKSLLINFAIVLILLFCLYTSKIRIILKILFIVNFILLFLMSFSKKDRSDIRYRSIYSEGAKERKKLFYNRYLDKVSLYNKKKSSNIYLNDISLKNKINNDMDDCYLQGKIRFFGYSDKITSSFNYGWTLYDTLFLIVCILIIIILFMFW
ncbi:MAG: hypothetical protein J6A52_02665 [Bacilli bacterium]|nr:hypothetical protein [Bacilli bacterium]